MDSALSCRDKLTYFRIKELKDVLSQLGLAKHGKKQELMNKILALLGDDQVPKPVWARRNMGREVVVKIIDDTYRKMQIPGAIDLASKVQNGSEFSHAKSKEVFDSYKQETKVRCPCGKSLITESMIQCEDIHCRIWQHIGCVIIPENPGDCTPAIPSQFYCEICRVNRADPFWITVKHVLFPVKLPPCGLADDSTITVLNEERTFQLPRSDKDLLQRHDYSLQVWCLLLNDKVLFRMHWPQYTELKVNGVSVRVVARPGTQLLGINGRDDGSVISTFSVEGVNKIVLSRRDARVFCFGIRLVKRLTVQQVLSLVPKEADGEHFQEALARVRRCVGGGADTENADSDSDIELVADSVTVNLRCPMTGSRIRIAGRFKPCVHLKGFDLEAFVELCHRSRKWQCPICLKNYALENIIIDPYFNRITSMLQNCGEDVTEVNLKADGSWCVKGEVEYRDLSKWHLPDGTLSDVVDVQAISDFGNLTHVKQKSPSERAFTQNLGIKLDANGGPEDNGFSSSRSPILRLENHSQNIINMSSSATGSYREGEDQSINQEFEGPFNLSLNNNNEFDSFNIRYGTYNIEDGPPVPLEPDVICLSDSDEDNIALISHEPIKSSNILLDEKLVAKVADFGLAHASRNGAISFEPVNTDICGTPGYMDPEYVVTQELTQKSDIYSYGVLLLELVTGRRAIQNDRNLIEWSQKFMASVSTITGLVDPAIEDSFEFEQLQMLVEIIQSCTNKQGRDRPSIKQVLRVFSEHLDPVQNVFSADDPATGKTSIPTMHKNEVIPNSGDAKLQSSSSTSRSYCSRSVLLESSSPQSPSGLLSV